MISSNTAESDKSIDPKLKQPLYEQEISIIYSIKYANYLVPCRPGKNEKCTHTEFAAFITPSGEKFIPVFTEPAELDKWPYGHDKAVILSFDDLKYTVLNDQYRLSGFIIDPFSKKIILRQNQIEQIDLVTEGVGIHNVKHSKDVELNKPTQEISELTEALRDFFSRRATVYKAYILMIGEPGSVKPHLLVVVDFDGQKSDLFPSLAKVISENLSQGETFEMMKASYRLLNMAASIVEPIYQKNV